MADMERANEVIASASDSRIFCSSTSIYLQMNKKIMNDFSTKTVKDCKEWYINP